VVHRDIKPDNIMLSSGQAVVTDLGIARAVDAAGGEQLTQTGMAIGTPSYMSPEQSMSENDVDGRTDVYALGCVLYEMLAGELPYTGTTPGAIIAKRLSAPIPDVRVLRETVPDRVEAALRRSLAKAPADRFSSATDFAEALRAERVSVRTAAQVTQPIRIARNRAPMLRRAVLGGVGVLAVLGFGWWATRGDGIGGDLDPNAIAVMPFRVGGDPAFGYLRESMLDLLGARLTGESGPRVLQSRTTLSAWRQAVDDAEVDLSEDDSRRVAAQLGAGQVMLGNIVATAAGLTVSASLLDVSDGTLLASGLVAGPPDSLAALTNGLTAQLLSLEAGEGRDRLEGFATTSLEALQQYLAGRRAYRAGDYVEAMRLYGHAFALDSNFVQAGFGMVSTQYWIGDGVTMAGIFAIPRVWQLRERLSAGDLAFLLTIPGVGPDFPRPSSFGELIARAEMGATSSPDSPEHWVLLGQLLSTYGAYSAVPDWADRAATALDRAIALDSSFAVAWDARLLVAMLAGDMEATRRVATAYEGVRTSDFDGNLPLWGAHLALGDSAQTIEWRDRFVEVSQQNLYQLPLHSIRFGLPLSDAHRAHEALRDRAATQRELGGGELGEIALALVEGRVQDAIAGVKGFSGWTPVHRDPHLLSIALFEAPYREMAMEVATRLATAYPNVGPLPMGPAGSEYQWPVLHDCHGALLEVVQGDTSRTRQAIRRLRAMTEEAPPPPMLDAASAAIARLFIDDLLAKARFFEVCPTLLEVMLDGPVHLDALDSLMQTGPQGVENMIVPGAFANLVIARMREAQGDIESALAAMRRRINSYNSGFLWPLPSFLREEGRLAAMAGDTTGAIRAYEHYLTLRHDPDPPLVPQRDSVVAELAELVGR
jgi:serine/threonine-protein kinase